MKGSRSEWLDGPGVVDWLDERKLKRLAEQTSARARMAINRWKRDGAANYYALDSLLTELSIAANPSIAAPTLLLELPGELFRDQPDYHPKKIAP